MSIAGDISNRIRYAVEKGARERRELAVAAFYERAWHCKEGYELDGELAAVAQYPDGSIAAYWPARAANAVRVLQAAHKAAALEFLGDGEQGADAPPGIYLTW